MDEFLAALTILGGLIGIFKPSLCYKSELLTPEKIAWNNKILKRGGILLVILGIIILAADFWK